MAKNIKRGMIFDLYQDGESTVRVMAMSKTCLRNLETGETIYNFDIENEAGDILIDNIFTYDPSNNLPQ